MALFRDQRQRSAQKDFTPTNVGASKGQLPLIVAFGDRDATWQLMLVRDGHTQLQTIRVGLMNDEQVQILEGLTAEDQVIAPPPATTSPKVWP